MRNEKWFSVSTAAALSGLLSIGTVGCLDTGFRLEASAWVYCLCFAASAIFPLLFSRKWGTLAALCLTVPAALCLWYQGSFLSQLLTLASRILRIFQDTDPAFSASGPVDLPLAALGWFLALVCSRALVRGKGIFMPLLLCALPTAACFVVTDTVPHIGFLFLLLAGFLLCLIPQSVRRENPAQGGRLTLLAAVPVLAALAVLFLAVPRESYVDRSQEYQAALLNRLETVPQLFREQIPKISVGLPDDSRQTLDLRTLGPRPEYTTAVLEVTADTDGPLYLRGQDYDAYTGTGWTATPHRAESFRLEGEACGSISVTTRSQREQLLLPYYPTGEILLTGGCLKNSEGVRSYTFPYTLLPEQWPEIPESDRIQLTRLEISQFGSTADRLRYTALPGQTKVRAEQLLETILPETADRQEQAQAIAEYVKSVAEYDLNTAPMANDAEDFALWFLEKAQTGYCVHYATAAVVLLRAADIPARYVTGYLTEAAAGRTVTVTAGDSHAWAEYYVPQLEAWVPLEVTPTREVLQEVIAPDYDPEASPTLPTAALPQEQTLPSQETLPTETVLPPETEERTVGRAWWMLLLAGAAGGLWLQRRLRLWLRQKQMAKGDINEQALCRWREASRLTRLLKTTPPESLHSLAMKAKFSQHTLTEAELEQFDLFLQQCRQALMARPWYLQIAYRLVYVVY